MDFNSACVTVIVCVQKYLELAGASEGSATIESVSSSSSGSSCVTETSIVSPQTSDERSGPQCNVPRTVATRPPQPPQPPPPQQQQQQQQQGSLICCHCASSAYDDRSQLLLTPITDIFWTDVPTLGQKERNVRWPWTGFCLVAIPTRYQRVASAAVAALSTGQTDRRTPERCFTLSDMDAASVMTPAPFRHRRVIYPTHRSSPFWSWTLAAPLIF